MLEKILWKCNFAFSQSQSLSKLTVMMLVLGLPCLCVCLLRKTVPITAWIFKIGLKHGIIKMTDGWLSKASISRHGHAHIFKGQETPDRKPGSELGSGGISREGQGSQSSYWAPSIRKPWVRVTKGSGAGPEGLGHGTQESKPPAVPLFMSFHLYSKNLSRRPSFSEYFSKSRSWPIRGAQNKLSGYLPAFKKMK